MKPDNAYLIAPLSRCDRKDHWADELPRGLTLEAAELIEIPYTFVGRLAWSGPSGRR